MSRYIIDTDAGTCTPIEARAAAIVDAASDAPADPTEGLSWQDIAELIDNNVPETRKWTLAGGDHERAKRVISRYGWGTVDYTDGALGSAVWRQRFATTPLPAGEFLQHWIGDGFIVDGHWIALMDHDNIARTIDYVPYSNGTTWINGRHA